ncbi:MAG: anthranilate phosphoribosyltransferase, partial [Chlamydiales bacterium]|nr:anthranilate phosphoribosyltransferase [Chlamydiales bacterium]
MMQKFLKKLVNHKNLSWEEMTLLMSRLIQGDYHDMEITAFLVAMKMKKINVQELAAAVLVMRESCRHINLGTESFVDVVSTGGTELKTFNISTTAMFIAAGAGVPMAKHGNRSIHPSCGSNDVLEYLGVNIYLEPEEVASILKEISVCYLFGPLLHKAMAFAMPSRRSLGFQTIFNLLEPMTNPAGARRQLIGAYSIEAMELMAETFAFLGGASAMIVHGADGLDEISTTAQTYVIEVHDSKVKRYKISPEQFHIPRSVPSDLTASSVEERGEIILNILQGKTGPKTDIALINA